MVNRMVFLLILALFLTATVGAEDIKVVAEVDQEKVYENEPFKGTITITHDQNKAVDLNSFYLEKKKLAVELVREVKISPNNPLVISIYSFSMSPQSQGLYALPPISVRVGGKNYESIMSSYAVQARKTSSASPTGHQLSSYPLQPSQASPSPTSSITNPSSLLRLEVEVEGNNTLYPGQRTKFVYHYFFSGNIALTTEQLPLLDAVGLIKIGEKEFKDFVREDGISINEISQVVEAAKPGKYSFGPSLIEGYAYQEDSLGKPVYTSDKLSSEAAPLVITVLPFPEKNKPASFNGAVGQYTFQATLLSPAKMSLGDEISLELKISGKGNLKNVIAPDLCCEPGFSGFFRLSDLPPSEEIEGDTKKVIVKLQPLNAQIKSIPSIDFSFFNPETALYTVLHSQPIPISIKANHQEMNGADQQAAPLSSPKKEAEVELKTTAAPKPIEIESILPLTANDLYNKPFGSWWSFAIIPFGIALLIYQSHLKAYLLWRLSQTPAVTGRELFLKAFAEGKYEKCDFDVLSKAFKLALFEAGLVPAIDIPDEGLPGEGLCGEVRAFWLAIDERRFGGKWTYDREEIYRLSQNLMNKIDAVYQQKEQGVR